MGGGTPLRSSLRTTGTTPHSQVGSTKPAPMPTAMRPAVPRGTRRCRRSAGTQTSTSAESRAPAARKGIASSTIAAAIETKMRRDSSTARA